MPPDASTWSAQVAEIVSLIRSHFEGFGEQVSVREVCDQLAQQRGFERYATHERDAQAFLSDDEMLQMAELQAVIAEAIMQLEADGGPGLAGLVDRSSKPDTCPHQSPAEIEARIEAQHRERARLSLEAERRPQLPLHQDDRRPSGQRTPPPQNGDPPFSAPTGLSRRTLTDRPPVIAAGIGAQDTQRSPNQRSWISPGRSGQAERLIAPTPCVSIFRPSHPGARLFL